jgi:hypothetical protein
MAKKSVMTADRKQRIKEMLSSRNQMERDSTPMMSAMNKSRGKSAKKNFLPKGKY